MALGQPVHLASKDKGDNSILVKRWKAGVAEGLGAARPARHGEGYTCFNPNSHSDYSGSHWKERLKPVLQGTTRVPETCDDLSISRRWAMSPFKGMSGAPKTRYYRLYERITGSPIAREGYGDGAPIVVRSWESRLHGEGEQAVQTRGAERYA